MALETRNAVQPSAKCQEDRLCTKIWDEEPRDRIEELQVGKVGRGYMDRTIDC